MSNYSLSSFRKEKYTLALRSTYLFIFIFLFYISIKSHYPLKRKLEFNATCPLMLLEFIITSTLFYSLICLCVCFLHFFLWNHLYIIECHFRNPMIVTKRLEEWDGLDLWVMFLFTQNPKCHQHFLMQVGDFGFVCCS